MKESRRLILQACRGVRPARTPIFDLLCNDAVIEHFTGRKLDGTADMEVMLAAAGCIVDGTRAIGPPRREGETWLDEQGNTRVAARWTSWIQHHALADAQAWEAWIRADLERGDDVTRVAELERMAAADKQRAFNTGLNGTLYIHCTPSTAINMALFGCCGLEIFSYLWADCPDLVLRWFRKLERQTAHTIEMSAFPEHGPLAMIYSDVAYKERLMFGKSMLNTLGFFDDVAAICAACHAKGLQVIFHSDGYIMDIIVDLIAAGIDGLNPIEKAAGMDVYVLRRLYPELILVGALDVTHLLPFGLPAEVRAETRRIINEVGAEGRLLIGSSTELEDNVPLANYLAFHDEVMKG